MSLIKPALVTVIQAEPARPAQPESHDCPSSTPVTPNPSDPNSGGVSGCVLMPIYVPVENNYGKIIGYIIVGYHEVCF